MFDLSRFKEAFPDQWQEIVERDNANRRRSRTQRRLTIVGVGTMPRIENTSLQYIIEALLILFPDLESENYEGREGAKKELINVRRLYEKEIILLIGQWPDEALRAIASATDDPERKFKYLLRLRRSNIVSYT
ncbi:MAG: hypothetical protein PHW52_04375 [Candidatus Pacebacteria bacterium]|nr:hypothetical protein [Candidatus Paceibacterota bacterium]